MRDSNDDKPLPESRQIWDAEAARFDDEPDHGLRDPFIRAAWTKLLQASLPTRKGRLLDIGCGTGSLSLVLAELGWGVTGIDFSPEMIARAETKTKDANQPITFQVMDAAYPAFPGQQFDAIICRHVLWALPETGEVLGRWVKLLKPGGRLCLIEGYWFTGAGLRAQAVVNALPNSLTNIAVHNLSDHADLWGKVVTDERYLITADLPL